MKSGKSRKKLVYGLGAITLVSALAVSSTLDSSQAGQSWHYVGNGNLDVVNVGNEWILYPTPTTYTPGVAGAKEKEFKMGSKFAYKMGFSNNGTITSPRPVDLTEKQVITKNESIPIIVTDGKAFLGNKSKTRRLSNGSIVTDVADHSNLYVISDDGSSIKSLLDSTWYNETFRQVIEDNEHKEEDKVYLYWAHNPHPVSSGQQIAYQSNRHSVSSGFGGTSVYVVNSDGSNDRILIDAMKYGPMWIVGAAKDIVVAHVPNNHSIIAANVVTGEIKQYSIQGWAESLSPNSKYLVFRKAEGGYILPDLFVLNLETSQESKISGMPSEYFYNAEGEWSPDGIRYAFYANGEKNINPSKLYRDNNLLTVIDTETMSITSYGKPPGNRSLYPLGAIHWIDSTHLITYSDDDTSWVVDVSK